MKKDKDILILQERMNVVQRFFNGEAPESICATLGRSRSWLYKWVKRYAPNNPSWCQSQSRQPYNSPQHIPTEIEELVKIVRLSLYQKELFCGDQAIQWELEDMGVKPLPSLRTINRILNRHGLTHLRTKEYKPKGKAYPKLPEFLPNQTHQADLVGPCYLKSLKNSNPIRFYSLNLVDSATNRCGVQPVLSRSGQSIINAIWAVWKRIGIPDNIQVDNEMAFYGSPTHPRGMGPLIRLCLLYGVEIWFIPVAEPWRNGVVEKFNDHYRQKFLAKVIMATEKELKAASLAYEHKHNSKYRYGKLKGKTPIQALARIGRGRKLIFPDKDQALRYPLDKPESGRYHLVRFIRSDCRLNIFGELFPVPPEAQYEYLVATIDVKEQKLKLFLDHIQVEEYKYQLR